MENFNEFIGDLSTLIACKSKKGTPQQGMPFGKDVHNAYRSFIDIAMRFGFEFTDYDGYIGEFSFGEGEEIGIIGHIDVVPEGTGWNTDPFTLTEKDGVYYGRGVQDDKSPLLICLYILKELKDSGVKPNKKFRFIVGCDEESGWADVKYFKTKSKFPKYGFSPDGNFPVSYAEKGINEIIFSLPPLGKRFKNLKGGTVFNAVCGYASVQAENDGINAELLQKHGLKLSGNLIESFGIAAHGSRPQAGKNALTPLFAYFADMGENVRSALDNIFLDKKELGKIKTAQGYVTMSPDIVEEKDGEILIHTDFRVPAPFLLEDFFRFFDSFGIKYTAKKHRDAMLVEKNGEFVQTLLAAYKTATGEDGEPISQSGGTFANVFEQGCAFGPEFENVTSSIHEANEHISAEDLKKLYKIYKTAIFELAK